MTTVLGIAAVLLMIGLQAHALILAVKGEQLASDQAEKDANDRHVRLLNKSEGVFFALRKNTVRVP